jgi:hypothetical protein
MSYSSNWKKNSSHDKVLQQQLVAVGNWQKDGYSHLKA